MEQPNISIRDFIYLDWDRVRSIAAQLFQGLPQEISSGTSDESRTGGSIEAGMLPFFRAKSEGDLRYFRHSNETRSFHHHIYSLLEEDLLKKEMVTKIDSKSEPSTWTIDSFIDGQFILVNGLIRLIDYNYISRWLTNVPKFLSTIQYYELNALKSQGRTDQAFQQIIKDKKREHDLLLQQIKNFRVDEMNNIVKELFGGTIRMKIVPNRKNPQNIFIGSGNPEYFNDKAEFLSQKYGYEIDANWTVFGQINISKNTDNTRLSLPTGNAMEDSMEQLFLALNDISRIAGAITFPAVSFTPITIYRTCNLVT